MKRNKRTTSADVTNVIEICEVDDTTCGVCYAEFLDPEDLSVHIEQVHPTGKLVKCQFCDKTLSDALNYALHIRDSHLLNFRSCWACSRVFADPSQFRKHESIHPHSMRDGTVPCSQCGQFFLHKYMLRQHEMEDHYHTGEGVFLDKYYTVLSSVFNIKAEAVIHSTGKDFVYNCSCCKYSNTDLEAYILHLKKSNCQSHVCDWCCKVYKKKGVLARHLTQHLKGKIKVTLSSAPSTLKSKQCPTCKEYFDLKRIKHHICRTNLKCSHCDTVFDTVNELSEHQTIAHAQLVALMVCKFCRKECVGKESLERHFQRAHSHELHLYKYTCSYCNTVFKHPQRLFAHYFLKHKDINPYLCKICDKKFRIRKAFTLHIKLEHKSEGFVEFDEKLHVFFTEKKTDKPFQPVSKYVQEKPTETHVDLTENRNKDKGSDETDLQITNADSDVNPTDAEVNQTITGKTKTRSRKCKKDNLEDIMVLSDYDSDDEPLISVKKKAKLKLQLRKRPLQWKRKGSKKNSKNQFTCKICKKYCYTFQNYQNHVNMHFRDEAKKCIKCSLSFKSKADLQRHITEQHSSSRLTETLKNIIERRKKGEQKQEISTTMKFRNTIKKVQIEKDDVTATLSPITKELSVQKFIENFTPEGSEAKNIQTKSSICLTRVTNPVQREPVIKMTKFTPAPKINEAHIKLAMPVRFKKCIERHSVTVRKVQAVANDSKFKFTDDNDGNQFQDDDNDYNYQEVQEDVKDNNIPEVEQEVTLGTEEVPKRNLATHKIVIPKLPKELKSIRIAHLLPTAPYYKIVKVTDIIKSQEDKQKQEDEAGKDDIEDADVRLPDGTKLVHVNPLAHLLGNTPVEQIMKRSSKYKSKPKNFEAVVAKALRKLDQDPIKKKKKKDQATNKELIAPEKSASETIDKLNNSDALEKEATMVCDGGGNESTEDVSREGKISD